MRLLRIVGFRAVLVVPTLLLVSFGAFALVLLLPGEPARMLAGGDRATPERIAEVRTDLGLDDPFVEQYVRWLGDAAHFDFGESLVDGHVVGDAIVQRMPPTLSIALVAVVVSIVLGVLAGTLAGVRPGTKSDTASIALATFGVAVPSFVVAILLVRLFALEWRLFPAVRYVALGESLTGWLKSVFLPGVSLGLLGAGALSRQLRSGLVQAAREDYMRTSWAVGSSRTVAVGKHALRNSAVPAVAVMGAQLTFVLGGTVVIERIFAIPGIGTYMFESTLAADLPAIRAVIVWYVLVQVAVYLLVDLALVVLNPRVSVT